MTNQEKRIHEHGNGHRPRGDAASRVGRHDLIGSDRVEGTNVYRSDGNKIGEIERVMIDKLAARPPTR